MTDPVPCTSTVTDSMREAHRWIITGVGVTVFMTAGIFVERLRMMWGDYKKRHKVNGSAEL